MSGAIIINQRNGIINPQKNPGRNKPPVHVLHVVERPCRSKEPHQPRRRVVANLQVPRRSRFEQLREGGRIALTIDQSASSRARVAELERRRHRRFARTEQRLAPPNQQPPGWATPRGGRVSPPKPGEDDVGAGPGPSVLNPDPDRARGGAARGDRHRGRICYFGLGLRVSPPPARKVGVRETLSKAEDRSACVVPVSAAGVPGAHVRAHPHVEH